MDTLKKFSLWTIILHWVIALGILFLIPLGIYMVNTESWHLYHTHKSIGLILFFVILARIIWRLKNGLPSPIGERSKAELAASKITHVTILVLTMLLPVTGMIYSGASGHGFGIFSLNIFPSNYNPETGQAIPYNETLMIWGQTIHSWLGYVLLGLIVIHLLAALKHHFINRDATLKRMLGQVSTD